MKKIFLSSLLGIIFVISALAQSDAYMFPNLDGWKKPDSLNTYKADDLWNIIDGAADGYLVYDFEELTVGDYTADNGNYITLEIYRHKTSNDAFGIYSLERPTKATYSSIGAQGYQEDANLNFSSGRYYVKIRCSGKSDLEVHSVRKLAEEIAPLADPHAKLPAQLSLFPVEGKIADSEQYILQNFMGYSFMKNAFLARYGLNGAAFNIFIMDNATPALCKTTLQELFKNNGNDQADFQPGVFEIRDKYNGIIKILWKGSYLCGIYNTTDTELMKHYIGILDGNLK